MFDELLDSKILSRFRESFVKYFKENIDSGISLEQLTTYMSSEEFRNLHHESGGYGPVYLGLAIHKLLDSGKIEYHDGRYVNGRNGIDSHLDENLTHEYRRELVRILLPGFEFYPGAGEMQGLTRS